MIAILIGTVASTATAQLSNNGPDGHLLLSGDADDGSGTDFLLLSGDATDGDDALLI